MLSSPLFWILLLLILFFSYVNGLLDGCNVVATIITSRSMKPVTALISASFVMLLSPFSILLIGSSVSNTIRKMVGENYYMDPGAMDESILFIMSGLIAAIIWNLFSWYIGIPSSASHSLIGGVVGAGAMAFGVGAVSWNYLLTRVILFLFLGPIMSFIVGFLIMKFIFFVTRNSKPRVNSFFKYAQWVNMMFLAYNHSLNDSQKSIGILMIILGIFSHHESGSIPVWVIASIALTLSSGTLFGGFRVIKTVGSGIYRVRPVHSFASQLSSGLILLGSSLLGAPVSSSQIVTSSVMGVGSADHYKAVHWTIVSRILISWVVTIPVAFLLGAGLCTLFRLIFL